CLPFVNAETVAHEIFSKHSRWKVKLRSKRGNPKASISSLISGRNTVVAYTKHQRLHEHEFAIHTLLNSLHFAQESCLSQHRRLETTSLRRVLQTPTVPKPKNRPIETSDLKRVKRSFLLSHRTSTPMAFSAGTEI